MINIPMHYVLNIRLYVILIQCTSHTTVHGSPVNEDYHNEYPYTQAQLETVQLFFNLISYFCRGETFSSILDMLDLLSILCPDYKVKKMPVIAGETIFKKINICHILENIYFLFSRLYFFVFITCNFLKFQTKQ